MVNYIHAKHNLKQFMNIYFHIAGFLCKYGKLFAFIGCFYRIIVVITGRVIG